MEASSLGLGDPGELKFTIPAGSGPSAYDDDVVRLFLGATVLWAVVGMLVGVTIALQLAWWPANLGLPYTTFGRLRPLHTNAVIFAFGGNICFTGIYYSMQRLLKTPMWSRALSRFHFWGWQAIIVAAAITLPLGLTQSKEYAELIWPIDLAIAVVWVAFAVNFFGTIAVRKVAHLYVAIWFYMSFVLTIPVLHIVNSLAIPATLTRSYPVYAGLTDGLVQWWYGHNAVGFFLTTPFLGLMYYFLPRIAERPVYSYRLSIVHFWALVFLYIWAGPHHLLYSALPDWAQTLGMVFSIMLLAPSWGGMLNGLLTLRGAWDRVRTDPILKFLVVAVSFYGMSTFEGPMMSIRAVNGLAHYTNWVIGHVHSGALGWVGMISFGIIYWLIPRLWSRPLAYPGWPIVHFWLATIGIVLYTVSMWAAGLTEGLMWRAVDAGGQLKYPIFVDIVHQLNPFYWMRLVGGTMYLIGAVMLGWNFLRTVRSKATVTTGAAPAVAAAS
ncbi:MAG TPA: cytochrome-c oxidase, cbb3-type subunit I [Gemmatimonadales bacterium]|nr:cytochrome-c oxidase, cbb3-type subunit I [Gemmatimonadales bacterium]